MIIPTGGDRQALLMHAVSSITPQLEHGDELIVFRYDCGWGHNARNIAMKKAIGTHIMFCDDDDSYEPNALRIVREAVKENPRRIHIFAMTLGGDHVMVATDPPGCGSVGTPMIVVPNIKTRLGQWKDVYEGDWWFLDSTMKKHPDTPIIHETPIARIGW